MNKKRIVIIISLVVVVVAVFSTGLYFFYRSISNESIVTPVEPDRISSESSQKIESALNEWSASQDKDATIAQLDEAIESAESSSEKQLIEGFKYKVYAESGDTESAITVSERLLEQDKSPLSYDRLAQAYRSAGNIEKALENYRIARQLIESGDAVDKQMELDYYDAMIQQLESQV